MGIFKRLFGPDARAMSAVQDWQRDRIRRGAAPETLMAEAHLRLALAGVRDRASAATMAEPAKAHEHVQAALQGELQRLAATDKKMAKQFSAWVATLAIDDVLYPQALAAHRATYADLLKGAGRIDPGLIRLAFGR